MKLSKQTVGGIKTFLLHPNGAGKKFGFFGGTTKEQVENGLLAALVDVYGLIKPGFDSLDSREEGAAQTHTQQRISKIFSENEISLDVVTDNCKEALTELYDKKLNHFSKLVFAIKKEYGNDPGNVPAKLQQREAKAASELAILTALHAVVEEKASQTPEIDV